VLWGLLGEVHRLCPYMVIMSIYGNYSYAYYTATWTRQDFGGGVLSDLSSPSCSGGRQPTAFKVGKDSPI